MAIILKANSTLNNTVCDIEMQKFYTRKQLNELEAAITSKKANYSRKITRLLKASRKEFNEKYSSLLRALMFGCFLAYLVGCRFDAYPHYALYIFVGIFAFALACYLFVRRYCTRRAVANVLNEDFAFVLQDIRRLEKDYEQTSEKYRALLRNAAEKKPEYKGNAGEQKVFSYIQNNFDDNYYLLNDVKIVNNGKSAQIDHILVGSRGVFCIETKNYSASYEAINEDEWKTCYYKKEYNKTIKSPQAQSIYHVNVLRNVLPGCCPIIPIVLLAGDDSKFYGGDDRCLVAHYSALKKVVSYYGECLRQEDVSLIAEKIAKMDINQKGRLR